MSIKITEIQRFCMHDGPGLRTTVFFKGCPLRCAWCHNPETQKREGEMLFYSQRCIGCAACADVCKNSAQVCEGERRLDRQLCASCGACAEVCPTGALETVGREYTVSELMSVIERDRAFYGEMGGVTLSGGEPFLQGEGAALLLEECKRVGINTAVETCGFADFEAVLRALPHTDLFLWDVKDTDSERHKAFTGVDNARITENLRRADSLGARIRLRCILVGGVNTCEAHYIALGQLSASLSNCEGVEFIPYHAYGGSKATLLGLPDNGRTEWIPDKNELERARKTVSSFGIKVY